MLPRPPRSALFPYTTLFRSGTGQVTFTLGTLAAGATGSATVTVLVTATSGTITNSAVISTSTTEANTDNDSRSFSDSVISADVSVTKTGPASPVTAGTNITYTVSYANPGTAAAQNVQLVDSLLNGVSYVRAPRAVPTRRSSDLTFTLGTLAAGATGSATVTVLVTATSGTITNSAVISTST